MRKKILFLLIVTLFFSIIMGKNQIKKSYARYLELEEKGNYIVVAKNNNSFKTIENNYDDVINPQDVTETLDDNNIMVTEIKLRQANELEQRDDVLVVEEDFSVTASGEVDFYGNQVNDLVEKNELESKEENKEDTEWNIDMINAKNGDNMNVTDKVKVAILDSGVEYTDRLNVVERKSFIPGEEDGNEVFEDVSGHGTSIAGILGARKVDGSTVKGVNSNIEIFSAKVLDEENKAPISRIIAGIYWAIDNNVNIISISFGTTKYSQALEIAIKDATDKGILVVAAAGNENSKVVEYPALFENVLAVGGVNSQGNISEVSSYGEEIDIFAPGEKVKSLGAFDGEVVVSGTSVAVPHVVGVASVLWQKDMTKSAEFVKNLIKDSANKSNENIKQGIVDLEYALSIYDNYQYEKVDGDSITKDNSLLQNTSYLETEDTSNYVTGSWGALDHKRTVTVASNDYNLTMKEIQLLKWGAVYSDNSDNLKGMTTNPYFHGYNKKKDYNDTHQAYNYMAGYVYLTRCALAGTHNQDMTGLERTTGILSEMDEKLALINYGGKEKFSNRTFKRNVLLGYADIPENRSLLLWGMAMHTAADVFAHSSYTEYNGKMEYISHELSELKEADNSQFVTARYASAKQVVRNVLQHYLTGTEGSVEDFILDSTYYDGSFKIRNIHSYASEIATLTPEQDAILKGLSQEVK